jgi:hypothetical protein
MSLLVWVWFWYWIRASEVIFKYLELVKEFLAGIHICLTITSQS